MITIDSPESLIIATPNLLAVLVEIVAPLSDQIDSPESLMIAPSLFTSCPGRDCCAFK